MLALPDISGHERRECAITPRAAATRSVVEVASLSLGQRGEDVGTTTSPSPSGCEKKRFSALNRLRADAVQCK
jgi:hypothetical protein